MNDKCFVDTGILVYAHDRSQHQRAQRLLEQLWDSGQGVLSTQVLQELCIHLRRKISRPPVEEVRLSVRDYRNLGGRHQHSRVCSPGTRYRAAL